MYVASHSRVTRSLRSTYSNTHALRAPTKGQGERCAVLASISHSGEITP